jgi:Flp pilus assembly protein CpaB
MKNSIVALLALLYAGPAMGAPPRERTEELPDVEADVPSPLGVSEVPPGNPPEITVPEGMRIESLSLLPILRHPIHRGGHVNVILNQAQSRWESDGYNMTFQHQLPIVEDVVVYYVDPSFGPDDSQFDVQLIVTPDQAIALAKHEKLGFYTLDPVDDDVRFYPLIGPARHTATGELVRADGTPIEPTLVAASDNSESESQPQVVSTAGRGMELTPGEPQTIEMHEHELFRVSLEKKIKTASGFNPDVIEVTASGTHGLSIQSSRAGATRLTIVDEDDESLELTVIVSQDMTDLELLLRRLYPDADIDVVPIRDSVLLRGTVEDEEQMHQIEEIAEQFAPQVLNQLRATDDSVSSTIPPGYRLVTITPRLDTSLIGILRKGDYVDVNVTYNPGTAEGVEVATRTLLSGVTLFAIDDHDGNCRASVLVKPMEADAILRAEQSGSLSIEYRSPRSVEESRIRLNEQVVAELNQLAATVEFDFPAYRGETSSASGQSALSAAKNRAVAIDIGTDPANLGEAKPGDGVDLFATDPGLASPAMIAAGVQLVGVVEPRDNAGRFVWLIVPPKVADEIDAKWASNDVTFSLRVASTPRQYPVPGTPAGANPLVDPLASTGAAAPSPQEPDAELQSLREDIRALHEDVRRLIKVLEDRQERKTDENAAAGDANTEQGAALLFFNADWDDPSRRMGAIVSRLRNDGLAVRSVDVDEDRDVVRKYHVTSIPTFVFVYDGKETERIIGATTENLLRRFITRSSSPRYRSGSEPPSRAWTELGMRLEEVAAGDTRLSRSNYRGAMQITEVRDGSPATQVGLRVGDLLVGLHVWETISPENVEYVLDHASEGSFAPLEFYVLRNGETLFGHFDYGERTNLDYPRQINSVEGAGGTPIAATPVQEGAPVHLVPLPARVREPGADPEG